MEFIRRFKRYVEDKAGSDVELLLKDLLDYAKRYAILLKGNCADERLNGVHLPAQQAVYYGYPPVLPGGFAAAGREYHYRGRPVRNISNNGELYFPPLDLRPSHKCAKQDILVASPGDHPNGWQ